MFFVLGCLSYNDYMHVDRESLAEKSLSQAFSASNVGVITPKFLIHYGGLLGFSFWLILFRYPEVFYRIRFYSVSLMMLLFSRFFTFLGLDYSGIFSI